MILAGLLLLGHRSLNSTLFGPLADELVIGAGPVGQLAIFKVQDPVHGAVQQAAVVADDDDRMGITAQVVFEPKRTFEIEIVGRFVEQQKIGLGEKHAGQRHTHTPATGIGRTGPKLVFVVKTKTFENRGRARLGGPCVDIDQTCLDLGNSCPVGCGFRFGHERRALGIGGKHCIDQRYLGGGDLLCDPANARLERQ